jgi:glycerol kinase
LEKKYVLALDQGTTSCRAILFDGKGKIVRVEQQEFTQIFPQPGWVEHDAEEIWRVQIEVARQAVKGFPVQEIAAVGITNQRETTVVWDRQTGKPLCNAIVWQDRRTAGICQQLKQEGWEGKIRGKTGLVMDPYFSATKLKWILDHRPEIREKANKGDALFGTIDAWLIWNLTSGKVHATDVTNASRTMLFNIHTLDWDEELLRVIGVPRLMLPEVKPSSHIYGMTSLFGEEIPVSGAAGDQQAALFGQTCFQPGMAKNTYGTGCFLLKNTGDRPVESQKGLLTTIAWEIDGKVEYAMEGSVFTAGAVIQWLRDGLGLIRTAKETEQMAMSVEDTQGVYFVPALTGLGAPYWNPEARGIISGLTRGAGREHIVRAALESIAYQSLDVLQAMKEESGIPLTELRVDGGAAANSFLMQFQADLLGVKVTRPRQLESTAQGAAFLAGLAVGFWENRDQLQALWEMERDFTASMEESLKKQKISGWHKAVQILISS